MAKKVKLEKVLECLIENDRETASRLLHDYFVEAAQEIHESLIAEDDLDDESIDELEGLDSDEVSSDEATEELGDELTSEVEGEEGDEELIDRIEDLEAQLEKLQSEFDELASEEAGDEEFADEEDFGDEDEEDFDIEAEDMEDDEEVEDMEDDEEVEDMEGDEEAEDMEDDEEAEDMEGDEDEVKESADWEDDDFLALDESAVDDLQKVAFKNTHAEVGAGSAVKGNNASPIVSRKVGDRTGGKGVEVKFDAAKGYEREKAPAYKSGTGAKSPVNVRSSATAGNSKVARKD